MSVPEMATESPNPSWAVVSEPFSSAVCSQTPAVLVNTYARPAFSAWPGAPTTTVVPEIATEKPNESSATVLEPFSSASCVPIDGAARELAPTAEAKLTRSGREVAATTSRPPMSDLRM